MRPALRRWPFLQTLPSVGVVVSDWFVVVATKPDPLRITGIYRCRLNDGDPSERRAMIEAAAGEARRSLKVPLHTPAVVALDPVRRAIHLPLVDGWSPVPVIVQAQAAAVAGLGDAGFEVQRFDALPAALARFARRSLHHNGRISAAGWLVSVTADQLDADPWPVPTDVGRRRTRARTDHRPVELIGVGLPGVIRRNVRPDIDAGAIGAAMRGFGFEPDVLARCAEPPFSHRRRTEASELPATDRSPLPTMGSTQS